MSNIKNKKLYTLPDLPFSYKDLEPYISEEQLRIHHDKHHQGYVDGANDILKKLDQARKTKTELDMKATLKALSFNIGGHVLHSLFWLNLAPKRKAGGQPSGILLKAIKEEFGSFERFKQEFSQASLSIEGSGWGALTFDQETQRLVIAQIEKHQVNLYPNFKILMVLDVWEHAYYLDYQNKRGEFIENFWQIVNWQEVERRFKTIIS